MKHELKNPYREPGAVLHTITFQVSQEAWEQGFSAFPWRGSFDRIFSNIFKKLISKLPPNYVNSTAINPKLAISSILGERYHTDDRPGAFRPDLENQPGAGVASKEKGHEGPGGEED